MGVCSFITLSALLLSSLLVGCGGGQSFDGVPTPTPTATPTPVPTATPTPTSTPNPYSGFIVVSTVSTEPSTGPGLVTMYDLSKVVYGGGPLKDYFPLARWVTGLAILPPATVLMTNTNNTTHFVDAFNLDTSALSNFNLGAVLAGTLTRTMATDFVDNSVYVVESVNNRIRKYDSNGNPALAISTPVTTGAFTCTLSTPYGIAVNSANQNIAVISTPAAAGRFTYFDKNGNCLANTLTTAPFNSGTPTAIAYHAASGKFLVTFATTHAIYAVNGDGSGGVQIYLNSAIINTPRAIATDADSNIYVGSSGTDTIEKLTWSGAGLAVRVGSGPFLGPSVYTQNPTAIVVIP